MRDQADSDAGTVRLATLSVGLTVAALVVAKSTRDALFLSTHDVRQLPTLMFASAVLSLAAAFVTGRALMTWGPGRVLPRIFAASAAVHVVEFWLHFSQPATAAVVLFLHIAAFGATSLAALWALINECFDPHRAKTAVSRIAVGGPVGGVLGGLAGLAFSIWGGIGAGIGALVVLCLAGAVSGARLRRGTVMREPAQSPTETQAAAGGYLRDLGALVLLIAAGGAIIDYWVSAQAASAFVEAGRLLSFFSILHMAVGVAAFLAQVSVARLSLEKLGIAGTTALLPASALLLSGAPFVVPALWGLVGLKTVTGMLNASLYRAGYELFYTPLPAAQKRSAKMLVDVALDRVGTALGAGLVRELLILAPGSANLALGLAFISGGSLLLCARLHGGYVQALTRSLRRGLISLSRGDLFDAASQRTLAETRALNRGELLAAIEQQEASGDSVPPAASAALPDHDADLTFSESLAGLPATVRLFARDAVQSDPVLAAATTLRSGSLHEVRSLLGKPIEPEWAPLVIALLGRNDLAYDAVAALRRDGGRFLGQLVDALLDPSHDEMLRRRIPRVLERSGDPRAVAGLMQALFDDEWSVRIQSGLALLELTRRFPDVRLSEEQVLDAVRRELDRATALREPQAAEDPAEWTSVSRRRMEKSVEFCMVALSLVLEREPLQLAYKALRGSDPILRGTALEYFETTLPEDIRQKSASFLEALAPKAGAKRRAEELVEALEKSRTSWRASPR